MQKITVEEILYLHYMAIEDFGGSHGVRSEDRLLSVAESPFQNVFGKVLYPSVYEKAAVYLKSIVSDHPFVDGNKRTATITAIVFLKRNGVLLHTNPIVLADFAVQVATDKLNVNEISAWLKKNSVKM